MRHTHNQLITVVTRECCPKLSSKDRVTAAASVRVSTCGCLV